METATGSGSGSLWQADKQKDWLTWEQNMSLQQQEELKSEEVNGDEDSKGERGVVVLGAKTELVPTGTLYVYVCVEACVCLSVCMNQSVAAFFSHCIITPLI